MDNDLISKITEEHFKDLFKNPIFRKNIGEVVRRKLADQKKDYTFTSGLKIDNGNDLLFGEVDTSGSNYFENLLRQHCAYPAIRNGLIPMAHVTSTNNDLSFIPETDFFYHFLNLSNQPKDYENGNTYGHRADFGSRPLAILVQPTDNHLATIYAIQVKKLHEPSQILNIIQSMKNNYLQHGEAQAITEINEGTDFTIKKLQYKKEPDQDLMELSGEPSFTEFNYTLEDIHQALLSYTIRNAPRHSR